MARRVAAAADGGEEEGSAAAVRAVAQAYELIKTQQPLLHLSSQPTELAQCLLGQALRALNLALSIFKQQAAAAAAAAGTPTRSVKAEPQLSAADSESEAVTRRGKRKRSSVTEQGQNKSSWVNLTTVPYEDGFEWRKYGEKRINGTPFTRSYFRCTYKDDKGCLATKQVQQKDNSDPPLFQVTYNNDHTCNCTAAAAASNRNSSNNLQLLFLGCCNSNSRSEAALSNTHPEGAVYASAMIKQEPQAAVLPPLADAAPALPCYLDDHTTFQEALFPVTNGSQQHHRHADGSMPPTASTTDSSCITGVSAGDEYSGGDGDMAATMEAAEEGTMMDDDPLRDLELFLLDDHSFNYYYTSYNLHDCMQN